MKQNSLRVAHVIRILLIIAFLYVCAPARLSANGVHDIHVSLCELRWNETASTFEVSIKIFIDDLELALSKEGTPGLFIGTPKEVPDAQEYISAYIEKHFQINIDGTRLQLHFLGKEVSEDFQAVWCYVEFPGLPGRPKKCTLSNDILLNLYEDQRNIMDIRMSKTHKDYTIFQPGHSTWSFTY